MFVFVDESGSFVPSGTVNAWNSIAAYVLPEAHRTKMLAALVRLKREAGSPGNRELKLKDLSELQYFKFLSHLGELEGVLFSVLIDMGTNDAVTIQEHQQGQASSIVKHIDKMRHEGGRAALQLLADQVADLPPQLYVQLQCQVVLVDTITRSASLYFVQRHPKTLGHFRWRIDQKNTTRTKYERTFFTMTPAILQSRSIAEPLVTLEGADYSAFNRFEYAPGEEPAYLRETYGIDTGPEAVFDVGKLFREDLKFVDSKKSPGIQVADLLAAGVRRTLRQEFHDNDRASSLLGSIMVQAEHRRPPLRLITLTQDEYRTGAPANLVRAMTKRARRMPA